MVGHGCRPDAIVYNAIVDALWQTGIVWAQAQALKLYQAAIKEGHLKAAGSRHGGPLAVNHGVSAPVVRMELNLHALTAGVAMLSLYEWLCELQNLVIVGGDDALPSVAAIVTDAGGASREQSNFVVKEAVSSSMQFWGAPFKAVQVCGRFGWVWGVLGRCVPRVSLLGP